MLESKSQSANSRPVRAWLHRSAALFGVSAGVLLGCGATSAFAQDKAPSPAGSEERIRKLEEAVKQLQQQNEELRRLVTNAQPAKPLPAATLAPSNAPPTSTPRDTATDQAKSSGARDVRFFWKEGLNFQSGDGKTFKGKIG